MITEFGKILRKIRIDSGEILKDMSDKLGMSSAYLSAIEVGKRPIPPNMIATIQSTYSLDSDAVSELTNAADKNAKSIKLSIDKAGQSQRNAALVFARNFDAMDKATAESILSLLRKGDN